MMDSIKRNIIIRIRSLLSIVLISFLSLESLQAQTYVPYDSDFDGCVSTTDLLDMLSSFGECYLGNNLCGYDKFFQGYYYSTVQIGSQCWFAENLRYLPLVYPSSIYPSYVPRCYVYGYEGYDVNVAKTTSAYDLHGVLYNHKAITNFNVCPAGWRVPQSGDFITLRDHLGGDLVAGSELKATDYWSYSGAGSNSSGFNMRASGVLKSPEEGFIKIGTAAYLASSYIDNPAGQPPNQLFLGLSPSNATALDLITSYSAMSVRCVKIPIEGCMDSNSCTFDSYATLHNEDLCEYPAYGFDCNGCDTSEQVGCTCFNIEISSDIYDTSEMEWFIKFHASTIQIAEGYGGSQDLCLSDWCYTIVMSSIWETWYSVEYVITNIVTGEILKTGTLDDAAYVDENGIGEDYFYVNNNACDIGCTDELACNYDPIAYTDDGSCAVDDECGVCGGDNASCTGCMDPTACDYDPSATIEDESCEFLSCAGCTDPTGCNYDSTATLDDSSCDYSCIGCMDATSTNYDPAATVDCADCCSYCTGAFAGTLTVGGGGYDYEIGWTIILDGVVIMTGGATSTNALCLEAGCYLFDMTDSFGDGWNGATYSFDGFDGVNVYAGDLNTAAAGDGSSVGTDFLDFNGGACTMGCTDAGACNYDAAAAFDDGTCDYGCVGCMDAAATNFDPNATIDSGLCVYCDPGTTFILNVNMSDSFGDGWNGAVYFVYEQVTGALMFTGDLDNAFSGDGLSEGADLVCLAPGCYTVHVSTGSAPDEVSVTLSDQFGTNYGTIGAGATWPLDFTLTGACAFSGCTSPTALNYNVSASVDDGSCLELPANDQLANAEAVACGASISGSLLIATDDSNLIGTEFGNNDVVTAGVWYTYSASADEQVTFSTCDTPANDATTDYTGDTKLFVYTQALDGSLVAIASNEDGCATGSLSKATINAETGIDYFIGVTEFSPFTSGNDFVLSVTCTVCGDTPSNDNCAGAIVQVDGVTLTGSTCCASAEDQYMSQVGSGTAYGVWFTFNSANYETFDFTLSNVSNDELGLYVFDGISCETITAAGGCVFIGACAGSVENLLTLIPNEDYYFCVFTTDADGCGDFEFTTSGVIFGCTDASATNYNPDATHDDGSCDFTGVVPANDICTDAVALVCNTVTTGSTGGATILGSPFGVVGCEADPGAGVWYSFVGDGHLHNLSTCGSAIDSKINIYTAATDCGGGFTCFDFMATSDGTGTCDLFDDNDVNFEFISTVGTLYYVLVGSDGASGTFDLVFDCAVVVEGCINQIALNYDPLANTDDGTCILPIYGCMDATSCSYDALANIEDGTCCSLNCVDIIMFDDFGDGWNGGFYTLSSDDGTVIGTGTIDNGAAATDSYCLADGCFTIYVVGGFWSYEMSWTVLGAFGVLASGFADESVTFNVGTGVQCVVGGCTDSGACNYDALATFDDGTCEYLTCLGCTDSTYCNYDPLATIDDGTCCYWNCVDIVMFDNFLNGWNGGYYVLTHDTGADIIVMGNGTIDSGISMSTDSYCLPSACYTIELVAGFAPVGGVIVYMGPSSQFSVLPGETFTFFVGNGVCP